MPTHEKQLTDFGEKIWGARKDLWTSRGMLLEDLEGASFSEKQKYVTKTNVLPKLNYQSLKEEGLSRNVIYFYKLIIDSLPVKPALSIEGDTEEKIQNYISYLHLIQNDILENVKTEEDINQYWNHLQTLGLFEVKHHIIYPKEPYSDLLTNKFCRTAQRSLQAIKAEANTKSFLMTEQEKIEEDLHILRYDGTNVYFEKDYYDRDTLVLKTSFGQYYFYNLPKPKEEWENNTYFILYKRNIMDLNIHSENEALAAKAKIIEDLISQKDSEEQKKGSTRKKAFIPPSLAEVKRTALFEWREADATPDDYLNLFKFRGGEFGNWENQTERQMNLNNAYDAFADIAAALGVSKESITGEGKLAIAFGSRGHSKALAHYEPDSKVINLTRMKGAGSLGHEWAHFLDNMLSSKTTGFATETDQYSIPELKSLLTTMKYYHRPLTEEEFISDKEQQLKRSENLLNKWINSLFPTTKLSKEQQEQRLELISKLIDDSSTNLNSYINFFYANQEEPLALQELSNYRKACLDYIISKEDRKMLAGILEGMGRTKNKTFDSTATVRMETEFFKGSKFFDDHFSGAGKGYWASDVEMFARAFHCYLKDKLQEKNIRNDYLCGHSEAPVVTNEQGQQIAAIPFGKERIAINQAFDTLIEAVKEQGTILKPELSPSQKVQEEQVKEMPTVSQPQQMSIFDLEDDVDFEGIETKENRILDKSKLALRLKKEYDEFLQQETDASDFKKDFFTDMYDALSSEYPLLDEKNIKALLEEDYILHELFDFYIKYEYESVDSLDETKELIENYNQKYHKEILSSLSTAEIISKNLDIKIDNYFEDLYCPEGQAKYFTPYQLYRASIDFLYDAETDSFVFQSWVGNIACPCSAKNIEIIGNTLLEICKKSAAGEPVEELQEIRSHELKENPPRYIIDFDSVPKERQEEYLNRLFIDYAADIDLWYPDVPGSCLFFKFDYLIEQYSQNKELSEDRRANAVAALKECKQHSVYYMNLNQLTPEEHKKLNYQDLTDKVTSELKAFKLHKSEGRRELYKYMASFKSSGYSVQNTLLIHSQCRALKLEPNAIGTFNEWKEKKTSIKPGEKALIIAVPTTKTYYYEYQADGTPKALPLTHNKNELSKYENLIKENKGYKYIYSGFNYLPRVFSITQTTLKENERPAILQRYNAESSAEQNAKYYDKLKTLVQGLNITFMERDSKNESLGSLATHADGSHTIKINPSMTTDAKIWTTLHEVGHFILHQKNNNPVEVKNLDHTSKEIQAELFANIVSEGLGINSEKALSSKYIDSYLKEEASRFDFNLPELESNHLMTHLKILDPAIKLVGSVLMQEDTISSQQLDEIKSFIPDIFEINNKNISRNIKAPSIEKNKGKVK